MTDRNHERKHAHKIYHRTAKNCIWNWTCREKGTWLFHERQSCNPFIYTK